MKHTYAGADWLRSSISARNKIEAATHERRSKLKKNKDKSFRPFVPMTLSPFGERVAQILGFVYRGIYHISRAVDKADWSNKNFVEICIYGELATFDASELTQLVVLCHDQKIRFSVEAVAPGYLKLIFHGRETRKGSIFERHPTIETAIETIRKGSGSEVLP